VLITTNTVEDFSGLDFVDFDHIFSLQGLRKIILDTYLCFLSLSRLKSGMIIPEVRTSQLLFQSWDFTFGKLFDKYSGSRVIPATPR
jgi:hypothetical protein